MIRVGLQVTQSRRHCSAAAGSSDRVAAIGVSDSSKLGAAIHMDGIARDPPGIV